MLRFLNRTILEQITKKIIPFALPLAILIVVYFLPQDDVKTLLLFGFLVLAFFIYKFDARIHIGLAIILLIFSAILTAVNLDDQVNRLSELAYWFLVVGIIGIMLDMSRKRIIRKAT